MKVLDNEETYLKALIYGDPGTGKTNFGVSAPNPLILLSERQALASIRTAAARMGVPAPSALYMETLDDYRDVLFALKSCESGGLLEIKKNNKVVLSIPYPETVVLDSVTDVGDIVCQDIERTSPPAIGKDGLPTWSMRHWQALGTRMTNLITQFRNVPANVLFLCLKDDREVGEGDEKSRQVGPSLPMRKLAATVSAAVNVIGITTRKQSKSSDGSTEYEYVVLTSAPDYVLSKPYRPLKDVEEPDFSKWVNTIRNEVEEDEELEE